MTNASQPFERIDPERRYRFRIQPLLGAALLCYCVECPMNGVPSRRRRSAPARSDGVVSPDHHWCRRRGGQRGSPHRERPTHLVLTPRRGLVGRPDKLRYRPHAHVRAAARALRIGVVSAAFLEGAPATLNPDVASVTGDFNPDTVSILWIGQAGPRVLDAVDISAPKLESPSFYHRGLDVGRVGRIGRVNHSLARYRDGHFSLSLSFRPGPNLILGSRCTLSFAMSPDQVAVFRH